MASLEPLCSGEERRPRCLARRVATLPLPGGTMRRPQGGSGTVVATRCQRAGLPEPLTCTFLSVRLLLFLCSFRRESGGSGHSPLTKAQDTPLTRPPPLPLCSLLVMFSPGEKESSRGVLKLKRSCRSLMWCFTCDILKQKNNVVFFFSRICLK